MRDEKAELDRSLRSLQKAILEYIPENVFEIKAYVDGVLAADKIPLLLNPGFEVPGDDPLRQIATIPRADWLRQVTRALIEALRVVHEHEEAIGRVRDLLCAARILLAKSQAVPLVAEVGGIRDTSAHAAGFQAVKLPLRDLLVRFEGSQPKDKIADFWKVIREATVAEEPDEDAVLALVTDSFAVFKAWVAEMGEKGEKRVCGDHALELEFERVQAVLIACPSPDPKRHENAPGQPVPSRTDQGIKWSEPMTRAEAGRRIWPSEFAGKTDKTTSKNATRRVQKMMDDGWLAFQKCGGTEWFVFNSERFQ